MISNRAGRASVGRPETTLQIAGHHFAPVVEPVPIVERSGPFVPAIDGQDDPTERKVLIPGDGEDGFHQVIGEAGPAVLGANVDFV